MTLIQIVVLSIIQGLTEFLPISSSAHLILGDRLFGWPEEGVVFDTAVHFGTLAAVVFYFRAELWRMARACLGRATAPIDVQRRRLSGLILLASVPVLAVAWLASGWIELYLRDIRVIAWATLGFGLLLWWADARGPRDLPLERLGGKGAMVVGVAQVLSLIPGTSRSGITITAGRLLGLDAADAARFSFLLSIPVIAAAGAYGALRVAGGESRIDWAEFALGAGLAAFTGWICIAAFLALVRRIGLVPFVIYRLALGAVLLYFTV